MRHQGQEKKAHGTNGDNKLLASEINGMSASRGEDIHMCSSEVDMLGDVMSRVKGE